MRQRRCLRMHMLGTCFHAKVLPKWTNSLGFTPDLWPPRFTASIWPLTLMMTCGRYCVVLDAEMRRLCSSWMSPTCWRAASWREWTLCLPMERWELVYLWLDGWSVSLQLYRSRNHACHTLRMYTVVPLVYATVLTIWSLTFVNIEANSVIAIYVTVLPLRASSITNCHCLFPTV